MKQSPYLDEVQKSMQPGHITLEGFLGDDPRNLIEILEEDDAHVKRLGLTHEIIANKMKEFREAGVKGLGDFISYNSNFEVKVDSVRGKLPSPFGGKGIFQKTNTTVENKKLGKEIIFSDLLIHLIEENGFYEGKGSRYRLDPDLIIKVLGIEINQVD